MSPAPPLVRAIVARTLLRALADTNHEAMLRRELGPVRLDHIENASAVNWLPFPDLAALAVPALAALGDEHYADLWRGVNARLMDSALLRPMVGSIRTVLGLTPLTVLKAVPRAWPLVFREVCDVSLTARGPNDVELRLHNLRVDARAMEALAKGMIGVCRSYLDLANVSGRVTLLPEQAAPAKGVLVLQVTWVASPRPTP